MNKTKWENEYYRKLAICKKGKEARIYSHWIQTDCRDNILEVDTIFCDLINNRAITEPISVMYLKHPCRIWYRKMKKENIIPFESFEKAKRFIGYCMDENEIIPILGADDQEDYKKWKDEMQRNALNVMGMADISQKGKHHG